MFSEFQKFVLRGNVLDLAVAVVIGAAFGAVVTSLVEDVITPIIAAVIGEPSFSSLTFSLGDSEILIGSFLNAVFSLLVVATAIFFLVIKPLNMLMAQAARGNTAAPTIKECPECLTTIPFLARRCPSCTTVLATAPPMEA